MLLGPRLGETDDADSDDSQRQKSYNKHDTENGADEESHNEGDSEESLDEAISVRLPDAY